MQLLQQFSRSKRIAIISHARPDADAIGSTLALGFALEQFNGENTMITMLNHDEIPERYYPLHHARLIHQPTDYYKPEDFDLIVSVDCATKKGLGSIMENWPVHINIDHHVPNPGYGVYNYVAPNYSSCCEYLYDLFFGHAFRCMISPKIADALLLGMIGDTGNFRYPGVTANTFAALHTLVTLGGDPVKVADIERQMDLVTAQAVTRIMGDGLVWSPKIAFLEIPLIEYMRMLGGKVDFVRLKSCVLEQMLLASETKLACVLTWVDNHKVIGSLRAKEPLDVNTFARENFGGGGHKLAAGFQVDVDDRDFVTTFRHVTLKNFVDNTPKGVTI